MFAVKAKIYGVLYNQSSSIAFDETSSYCQHQKAPNFLAFHWSPQGSLVSIGQHVVTTRVVNLPKRTETSLITEVDLITELDQIVRAVHSCNSWLSARMILYFSSNTTKVCPLNLFIKSIKHSLIYYTLDSKSCLLLY